MSKRRINQKVAVKEYIKLRNAISKKAFKEFQKPFSYLLNKVNKSEEFSFFDPADWLEFNKLMKISILKINDLSLQEIRKYYFKVYNLDKKEKSLIQVIQNKSLNDYNKRYTAKKVGRISKATQGKINNIVTTMQAEGKNRKEIAKQIMNSVEGMKKSRALTIARTETANATSVINHSSLAELGFKRKWVHVGGGKTDRSEHLACDNEIVGGNEIYSCGLSYPHEPGADAGDIINCYCMEIMAI